MSQFFQIHPSNPQLRLLRRVAEIIMCGGIVVYPSDSCYALGCKIGDKSALSKVRSIRQLDKEHEFTLICRSLAEISGYARVSDSNYRLLKFLTPGPYTFILEGTNELPRYVLHEKRKTIGIRIPDNAIAQGILKELDTPILSTSLIEQGSDLPLSDPFDIRQKMEHQVALVIDGGPTPNGSTTIIDLTTDEPQLIRSGLGNSDLFVNERE